MNCLRNITTTAILLAGTSLAAPALAGTIVGQVVDTSNTRALQSAEVTITESGRTTQTERDGSFRFSDVPAGTYTIVTRYSGADVVSSEAVVPESGDVAITVRVGPADGSDIVVIGQAANLSSSLSRQRAADGVSSVLTRDAIGQFPDQNVAESLRRLPGVNILNDQGEGRFVSVRGLDPELNSSSLNGVRLPAPESDVRSVALDVISSDTIESIEVKKSLTPDMDGDTIGASIEIKTTSAFDRKKPLLGVKLEGSYNDYANEISPKANLDFATRIGENFGIAGGLSFYNRTFETDNIEAGGWTDNGTIDYVEEVEYRDYDVERQRISASLNFDARVSDSTTLYARGSFSQFDDQEFRRRTILIFDEEPASGDANSAVFSDADGRIEVRRDIKDRFERQRIQTISVGGDTDTGVWKFNWSGSWAKSSEKEDGSVDPTRFRGRFDGDGVDVAFDYSDRRVPLFNVTSGSALFNDPSEYGFNRAEFSDLSDAQDEEFALKADLARTFAMNGGDFTVQSGIKSRWRDKKYDFDFIFYGDYDGDYTLADVLGEQTYRLTDMGPVASFTGATEFLLNNLAQFEVDPFESDLESSIGDYSVREDILAGYLLGRWESSSFRAIGGVRVERTFNELNGNLVVSDGSDVFVTPVTSERRYTDWLPSLTLRYDASSNFVLRGAGYKSLVRPKLSDLAPRYSINEDDEAEFGNPDLLPYKAWNFDASAEYYFNKNGAISLGAFYKSIDNFVVDGIFEDDTPPFNGTYRGTDFAEAVIPVNGDKATIFGLEASFSQILTFLPSPLDGFLVQANYTYTDAKGTLFDGREIALPTSSRNTFNVVLGYDKGPFDVRAAGTYRSKYLDEIGGGADEDRFVDKHFQVDISAKFAVTENIRLFAEWINVNNAKYFAYQNYNNRQRLLQYEEYGPTFKFGARVNF